MSFNIAGTYVATAAQNPTGYTSLGKTILAAPAASISVDVARRNALEIVFYVAGKNLADITAVRVNADNSAVYDYAYSDGADVASDTNKSQLRLSSLSTSGTESGTIRVVNIAGDEKTFTWSKGGTLFNGAGAYKTTAGTIASVQLLTEAGKTFNTGSYVEVFGAD